MQPTSYDETRRGKAWEGEILPFSKEKIGNRKGRAEMQTGRSQREREREGEEEKKSRNEVSKCEAEGMTSCCNGNAEWGAISRDVKDSQIQSTE